MPIIMPTFIADQKNFSPFDGNVSAVIIAASNKPQIKNNTKKIKQ